jgi:hypothetical protein
MAMAMMLRLLGCQCAVVHTFNSICCYFGTGMFQETVDIMETHGSRVIRILHPVARRAANPTVRADPEEVQPLVIAKVSAP